MSFFTILLSISILYYSQARSIRSVDNDQYEANLDAIIKNLTDCLDQKLEPLLSQLSNDEQNNMRGLALSGISSYVENMASYINSKAAAKGSSDNSDDDYYGEYYDDTVSTIEITDEVDPPSTVDDSNSPTNSTETPNTGNNNIDSASTAVSTAVSSSSSS